MRIISDDKKSDRRRHRVLLVEANVLLALDIEELLSHSGCDVVGRSVSVQEALAFLDSEPVDIAIVDYVLKDGTAESVALALSGKGIPFAIFTARAEAEMRTIYRRTPILGKPYGAEDVARVMDTLISARLLTEHH
jgi:DNA-binding response OmpR family regulator